MTPPDRQARFDPASARVVATIEARMTSTRLPGKILAPVGGKPMLLVMLERLRRSQTLTEICVATTSNTADDEVARLALDAGAEVFRGSEHDVLDRVLRAADHTGADVIVQLTADCPFIDPALLDACVISYLTGDVDLCANCLEPDLPRGLDVKVFSRDLLRQVADATDDPADHEHVSLFIYERPERYRLRHLRAVGPLHRPGWRWTVDTAEDLAFADHLATALGTEFSTLEAVEFLEAHPEIVAINTNVTQKPVR